MATRYDVLPIPALMQFTETFEAGAVTFGVEYRLLNEEIIAQEFGADSRAKFGNKLPPGLPEVINEDGVSVHVFGTEDEHEYLRFDCFDDYPHYHYITPAEETQLVLEFDPVADGSMVDWVVSCLAERLPVMLEHAGASELAEKVDPGRIGGVLGDVEREIRAAADRGTPVRVQA